MPTPRAQSAGTAPIDPARAQLVDAARTAWIGRLIDLSRRNNLLFYRPIPTSSIDLTTQNPGLLELLAGRSVTGESLLPDPNARARGNRELRQTGFSTENALPSEMPSEWPQSAKRGVLGHSWRRRCSKSRYGPQLSPSKSMYSGSSPPTVNRSYLDSFYRHIYC
jgi:hypothetical protein